MTQPFNHIIVVFRNDDISALSDVDHERGVAGIFEQYGVPQTLGIVPLCAADSIHNPRGKRLAPLITNQGIVSFLRDYVERSGSEIALHGYTHRTNRLSRPSNGEYFEFKGISLVEQKEMVKQGTEIIEEVLKKRPQAFIPSWNRLDLNTLIACKENGYSVVSGGAFTPCFDELISLGTDCDINSFPFLIREARLSDRKVFLRILYHSRTIRGPERFKTLEQAVRLAAETPGCETLTISEAANRYPAEIRTVNEAGKNIGIDENSDSERTLTYRKVFDSLPQSKRLDCIFKESRKYYYRGRYDEVCALSPSIEYQKRKLLFVGRALSSFTSFVISILAMSVIFRLGSIHKVSGYFGAIIIFLAIWMAIWWYTPSSEARREIRLAGILAAMACGCGILFWHLMSALF